VDGLGVAFVGVAFVSFGDVLDLDADLDFDADAADFLAFASCASRPRAAKAATIKVTMMKRKSLV